MNDSFVVIWRKPEDKKGLETLAEGKQEGVPIWVVREECVDVEIGIFYAPYGVDGQDGFVWTLIGTREVYSDEDIKAWALMTIPKFNGFK